MTLFMLSFLLIYGSLHYCLFSKLKAALHPSPPVVAGLVIFLASMTFAPLLINLLERQVPQVLLRALAYVGYSWMGFLFLLASLSLLVDFYRLLHYLATRLTSWDLHLFFPAKQPVFFTTLFLSLGIFVYGIFEAREIRIEKM